MNAMIIGKNIERLLSDSDKNQEWLAEKVGVSQATVSFWINGKNIPRRQKLNKIAHIFSVTIQDLLDESNVSFSSMKKFNEFTSIVQESKNNVENFDKMISSAMELDNIGVKVMAKATATIVTENKGNLIDTNILFNVEYSSKFNEDHYPVNLYPDHQIILLKTEEKYNIDVRYDDEFYNVNIERGDYLILDRHMYLEIIENWYYVCDDRNSTYLAHCEEIDNQDVYKNSRLLVSKNNIGLAYIYDEIRTDKESMFSNSRVKTNYGIDMVASLFKKPLVFTCGETDDVFLCVIPSRVIEKMIVSKNSLTER